MSYVDDQYESLGIDNSIDGPVVTDPQATMSEERAPQGLRAWWTRVVCEPVDAVTKVCPLSSR